MKHTTTRRRTAAETPPSLAKARLSRRGVLTAGLGGAGLVGAAVLASSLESTSAAQTHGTHGTLGAPPHHTTLVMPGVKGEVDHARNGFNPTDILTDFDAGAVSTLPNGQVLHEYTVYAVNKN